MAHAKRSAAQRANDKRLGAMAKARAAKRRSASHSTKTKTSTAKRSGSRAHAKPSTSVVVVKQTAPAAKPASKARAVASKDRASAAKMKLAVKPMVNDVLIPVAIGGVAASVVDVAYGAARSILPAAVADHPVAKPLIKIGAGIGIAYGLQHFGVLKPAQAKAAAIGVGIVQVHNAVNGLVGAKTQLNLNGVGMTLGELAAVLPDEANGLEALGMLAAGNLGAVLPYQITDQAA